MSGPAKHGRPQRVAAKRRGAGARSGGANTANASPPREVRPRARSSRPAPAAGGDRFDPADLEALQLLRKSRQALGQTVRSSKDYWSGVRRVLEIRATLEQAEGRFRELYDFIPIPFLVLDRTLQIVASNAAANALTGHESGVPAGLPLVTLLDPGCFRELKLALASGQPPRPIEGRLRTARGDVPVQITAQTVDHGRTRTHYATILDVSEVRRLEQERRALELEQRRSQEAERLARDASRAKDEFIAMLSHELRTPLTPILAAATAIEPQQLPVPVCAAVATIRRNVLAEARLIDDLLEVQQIRLRRLSIARRPLRLHEVLGQVIEDWRPDATRRRLRVEVSLDAAHDLVDGDAGRLAQVFRNLLGNAAKFTGADGRVRVRTANERGRIRISIADTGSGMTQEQLRDLFSPFAEGPRPGDTRSGLGLGLVISRGILEAHGGRIDAYSPGPGAGSCVEVSLDTVAAPPAAEAAAPLVQVPAPAHADAQPTAPRAALPPARPRVLLVEDHADSAETLSMVLGMKGYDVRVAPNLAEARRLAPECELLISDISLPDGSGLDLVRELRRERDLPAIALSGLGTEDDVQRSREAGFAEHLIKPVDVDQLLAALGRLASGELQPNRG